MKKVIVFLIVIYFGWLVGREWWWKMPSTVTHEVTIAEGSTTGNIAWMLKQERIIGSQWLFKAYAKLARAERKLQPGTFTLAENTCADEVLEIITDATALEVELTFIEGWTLEQMGEYLEANGVATKSEWVRAASADLEGYLFPDTYRFLKGASAEAMVKKLRDTFAQKAEPLLAQSETIGGGTYTPHEVLTLASIVEAEVRGFEDRKKVADIFLRRLEIGMPLQADSTVNYLTKKKTPSISFADRDIDSPYNTYKYRGLPPGPINNPGAEAIRAVLEHEPNTNFFFLTDPEGTVYYAKTLDEHNVNKARYLR